MNYRLSKGFITFIVGPMRIQFYWPEMVIRNGEVYLRLVTIFRAIWSHKRFGAGFRILGFGFGGDYEAL